MDFENLRIIYLMSLLIALASALWATKVCCCFNICACCVNPDPSFCVAITVCANVCGCAPASVTVNLTEVIIEPADIPGCTYFWKTWRGYGAMTGCVIHDGFFHIRLRCIPFSDGCNGYKLSASITSTTAEPTWGSEYNPEPCTCDDPFTLSYACAGISQNDECYPCIGPPDPCTLPASFSFVVTKCP